MNYIKNDYLDFVPNLLIGETNLELECIWVCCHLKNGKIFHENIAKNLKIYLKIKIFIVMIYIV